MNIEHQKNFERWIKERIKVDVTDRERQLYCVNRIAEKDNRINNLEMQVKQLQANLEFNDETWRDYIRGS
jgi:polyhydroxyalkanoate synthesis regulator phasin